MFTPEPYGLHVPKGFTLSGSDSAFIKGQVAILRNRLDLADQQSGRRYATLPSGKGTIVITESFGITRVIVQPTYSIQSQLDDRYEFTLPIIYSGRIINTRWETDNSISGIQVKLTQQARRRIAGYDPNITKTIPEIIIDRRFNIELHEDIERRFILSSKPESRFTESQYEYLLANWWSGSMASAVQLIRGYGKSLSDNDVPPRGYVPLRFEYDEPVDVKYWTMPYEGKFDKEGYINYRFFFEDCHGISFDDANEPWLVHISPRGVYVMPLPVIPDTTRPEFREWCEQVGDEELLHILDVFGGIPTGESFPENMKPWEDVGLIQRVCDTSEFYDGEYYSDAIGWSFNNRGHSAVNCCKKVLSDGTPVGRTFELNIELGHIPQVSVDELDKRLELFNKFMRQRDIEDPTERKLFLLKTLYSSFSDVEWALQRSNDSLTFRFERDSWDKKSVVVGVRHNVSLVKINEGMLYHPNPIYQPQFKLPETRPFVFGGFRYCKSIEIETETPSPDNVVSNACVYAYFADDDLKMVYYFYDNRSFDKPPESNKPSCAILGSWVEVTYSGGSELAGNWYTNEVDDRHSIDSEVTTVETEHTPVGFGTPFFTFFPPGLYSYGQLTRSFIYNIRQLKTVSVSSTFRNALIVPWGFRDGVIYAKRTDMSSGNQTLTHSSGSVADPNSYIIYTYHRLLAYLNNYMEGNVDNMPVSDIDPAPRDFKPVVVVGVNYAPSQCSDTFEEGGWQSLGDDITDEVSRSDNSIALSGNFNTEGVRGQRYTSVSSPVSVGAVMEVSFSFRSRIDICNSIYHREEHYQPSPDPDMPMITIMLRSADCNRIGEKFYAAVDELGGYDGKNMELNRYWGYTNVVDVGTANCQFIGVINE